MKANDLRRSEAKRLAVAKIKATEAPFKFYERDMLAQKEKAEKADLPADMSQNPTFRAGKIPWKCLVPLYKAMIDEYEQERQKRVRRNAEVSLSLSKLPPRMEAYEKRKQEQEESLMKTQQQTQAFAFKPPAPKNVPDFKRLHKEFASKLERNKSAHKLTTIQPFHFHEPKNDPSLRKHLDEDNQKIKPTKKMSKSRSQTFNKDIFEPPTVNPPSTKKHDALVALRRENQNKKIVDKMNKKQEDKVRAVKQVRLTSRVKQSPALSNNTLALKRKRKHSLQRARDQMRYLENVYMQQKAIIDFNVANRPLLVEQQTQEFINLYNQIRDLQQYVAILRNANLDPNDHLTDDQKILLQRAQYFD